MSLSNTQLLERPLPIDHAAQTRGVLCECQSVSGAAPPLQASRKPAARHRSDVRIGALRGEEGYLAERLWIVQVSSSSPRVRGGNEVPKLKKWSLGGWLSKSSHRDIAHVTSSILDTSLGIAWQV